MVPSFRQLEYFVAVAEHLNFGRAAEACFVTQPGLSAQLRQLEDLLEVRLFERDRRGVILTPAGATLLPTARQLLADGHDLVTAARGLAEPLTGTLRMGVIPTIAPYLLPRILPPARRRFPNLRLLLREGETSVLVEELESGKLDLVLLATEADIGDLETLELQTDDFWVVMHDAHPLAARQRIRQNDLADQDVLLLEDGH